jgi:hypothetical protein
VLFIFAQNREGKMNKDNQKSNQAVDERYGVPVYQSNPIQIPQENKPTKVRLGQLFFAVRLICWRKPIHVTGRL